MQFISCVHIKEFWGDFLKDITKREILILLPLLFLVVGLGVYPSPLIDMIPLFKM